MLLHEQRGSNGFGYDPLFYFPELNKSFAELSREEKLKVSHRGAAFHMFLEWMKASPRAEGVDAIYAPGEPEEARRAERGANGIAIDPTTWRQIRESAQKSGMPEAEIEKFAGALD